MASLQKTLPAMYEEVFKNVVLTSFEKSCQEMFRQVNEAFQKGTIECKEYCSVICVFGIGS